MTAKQFRQGGDKLAIRYTVADCALGRCLVAESERGICAILLGDDDATLVSELHELFPAARGVPADPDFQQRVREVIAVINSRNTHCRCRWIFGEPRFSSRCGRRCVTFPVAKR